MSEEMLGSDQQESEEKKMEKVMKENKLKAMREAKGLSQSQLAKKSGVHLRTLQYYEQGRLSFDRCRIDKICAVALALDCNIEDLMEGENVKDLLKAYQNAD